MLLVPNVVINAQTLTSPQVNFSQRTSAATPAKTIYNVKGDFTMVGNTNLTLVTYGTNTDNEGKSMKYVDIDGNSSTLNSSMATLEISNSGENSANQSCSTILYAGLYWTGKSDDANETFSVTKNSVTKNYDKKVISIKGPGAAAYTTITAKPNGVNSDIRFPGASQSGIFIGYQEITDYVKTYGPGAYTVADIALTEGTNANPGLSGGWVMVVIYENPLMKSRAVTVFDGYAFVNGQLSGGGEYGNIPVSGFTTVGSGPVNMKLGVMAAEGDIALTGDYLAVQKLTADPNKTYNNTNYLTLNHSGNSTNNFFNSSIFPVPVVGKSNPILQNNTGVDFSMFTIPNSLNSVIANNQTATTFRFGSSSDVFTIFGFAMSVDAYIPEPKGLISVNSINNVTNPPILNALPGQTINYSLNITNEGTEATNNTIITIPIPTTAIFNTGGTITYHTFHGFSPGTAPYYDSATNKIIWNLGTLPITSGHPEYVYADLSFTLNVTNDCSVLINAGCNPLVSLEKGTIIGTGAISGSSFTKYFFQGYDNSSCHLPIDGSIKVAINTSSCTSTLAGADLTPSCGLESVKLAATSGTSGSWSIVSGPSGGGEIFSNSTSPASEFYSPNTGVYTLRWTISSSGGCPEVTDDVQISIGLCNKLDFDGIDDNVNFSNNFNLNSGAFSIETWIKPGATNGNIQTIFSKRNSITLMDGYDLRLVNNTISFNWNNGNSIPSTFPVTTGRWYHVAVTFDGTSYKLYIDGVIVHAAVTGSNPTANSSSKCILGAMIQGTTYPYLPTNYFTGWMQELRVWNVALTEAQTHQMMNQKIENNSTNVFGSTVPLTVSGLTWGNLAGYYQMIQQSDLIGGYLIDKTANTRNGRLIGIGTAQPETAPLPYTSSTNNAWENTSTWTYGNVWSIPNTKGVDNSTFVDWNIVKTDNNITTIGNKTVLGLIVGSNTLGANNDNKIEISHYLKLNGKIDLVGKSQLVQTDGSILDVLSAGSIERDQQGQSNKYNYNYWSSPVSPINTSANNIDYTVTSVMKDGSTTTPQTINWIGGYDGSASSPISLARYWIYKFDNSANAYANWSQIGETGLLRVGQGFTLKGSGSLSGTQNYTFVGKPNNGTIASNSVSADQLLLTGNPYPSAMDANAFINDNLSSMDGTLYFWEQYTTNDTHILRDYQGGYAERNLTGGVPSTSVGVDFISGLGSSTRGIPNQFIPVGQSFFVYGNIGSGGPITYKNSQRGFHKEDEVGVSNMMFKSTATKDKIWNNNNNDIIQKDTYKRIRLGYNSNNNYHRQVLLGFMDEKATSEIDNGYDGYNFDYFPNDMYFLNGEDQLVIQGEGFFDRNSSYPIGVKADTDGKVKFMLDGLENFDKNEKIFIYDSENNTYNDIRKKQYEVLILSGENNDRFSLCFKEKIKKEKDTKDTEEDKETDDVKMTHLQKKNVLEISNKSLITSVQKVTLYNMNGQSIATWEIENQNEQNIQLPILNLSSGIYIAKVQTSQGGFSKKIIIP